MQEDIKKNSQLFKALSDPIRLSVLNELKSGEKCACVLLEDLDIGQSGLSYHMKILCDSGIVNSRQEGKWTHYSLSDNGCKNVIQILSEILNTESKTTIKSDCNCINSRR